MPTAGKLTVVILEAKNLKKMDVGGLSGEKIWLLACDLINYIFIEGTLLTLYRLLAGIFRVMQTCLNICIYIYIFMYVPVYLSINILSHYAIMLVISLQIVYLHVDYV